MPSQATRGSEVAPVEPGQAPSGAGLKIPKLTKAIDALNLLGPLVGGPIAARELIIDQVYQGQVRAFALQQWETRGNLNLALKEDPPADALRKAQIPRKLLRPTGQLAADIQDWNWKSGRFFVTIAQRPTKRRMLRGVRFASDDIQALAKAYGGKVGKGGRPLKMGAWGEVWMQLVVMAAAGELTKERQVNRGAFRRTVFEHLGWDKVEKPPLEEGTIAPLTGAVWDRLIEPKIP